MQLSEQLGPLSDRCRDLESQLIAAKTATATETAATRAENTRLVQQIAKVSDRCCDIEQQLAVAKAEAKDTAALIAKGAPNFRNPLYVDIIAAEDTAPEYFSIGTADDVESDPVQ